MVQLARGEFEELVAEGVAAVPVRFRALLSNVAIVVEGEATPAQLRQHQLTDPLQLFGLYEGVPQSQRGPGYSGVLPDKITIFQRPIEHAARDAVQARELVRDTVWHELAHHFGFDERRVRRAEARRRRVRRT